MGEGEEGGGREYVGGQSVFGKVGNESTQKGYKASATPGMWGANCCKH